MRRYKDWPWWLPPLCLFAVSLAAGELIVHLPDPWFYVFFLGWMAVVFVYSIYMIISIGGTMRKIKKIQQDLELWQERLEDKP